MRPLLPEGPKNVVRDAARAAKRTANLMIERGTTTTLRTLLGLPGLIVTEYAIERQERQEVLHVFCRHEHQMAICPRCGQVSDTLHEQEERCIRHLAIWGKTTYGHFPSRRFDGKQGKKPFTERLSWVENKRRESTAYELHGYEQCTHTDQAAVAEREGLHVETVAGIVQRWARRAEKQRQYRLVRCLGGDASSLRNGHQQVALGLSDLERHGVVAMLPERSQQACEAWLDGVSEAERQAIRLVAMDMWGSLLWCGTLHIATRTDGSRPLPWDEAVARCAGQHPPPLAVQGRSGLPRTAQRNSLDLGEKAERTEARRRSQPSGCPERLPGIVHGLLAQRTLCGDCGYHPRPLTGRTLPAGMGYEAQASGLVQLGKFTQTLQHWWEEFLTSFNEGFTSAVVEGWNNAIRGVIRRAYGYHVFEHFRLHVLVEHGNLPAPLPQI